MSELTVIKVGTAVVSSKDKTALDIETINSIGADIARMNTSEVTNSVLVTSGAVTAGIERLGWTRAEVNSSLDRKRVASMAGNMALVAAWEQATGRTAAFDLPTHNDLDTKESWQHLEAAIHTARSLGLLAILNEGDARSSEELETILHTSGRTFKRFGDNDWLAAHLAVQLKAESLVFLSSTDGVLKDGKTLEHLSVEEIDDFVDTHIDDSEASNGGMTSKLLAAKLAIENNVNRVHIGNGKMKNALRLMLAGQHGTAISQ